MTIDAMKVANERYDARTIDGEIHLLDYNGQKVAEVVRKFNGAEALRVSSLLIREHGLGAVEARRRRITRAGQGTVRECEGCCRVRGTRCATFTSPALMWDNPNGCNCKDTRIIDC